MGLGITGPQHARFHLASDLAGTAGSLVNASHLCLLSSALQCARASAAPHSRHSTVHGSMVRATPRPTRQRGLLRPERSPNPRLCLLGQLLGHNSRQNIKLRYRLTWRKECPPTRRYSLYLIMASRHMGRYTHRLTPCSAEKPFKLPFISYDGF
jgi:hypothetical protein